MRNRKNILPKFDNEEQEAEYWDKNSPLDVIEEPKAQKVKTTSLKDRPITIRLDSENRSRLEKVAARRGFGPSTFTRTVLISALQKEEQQTEIELGVELPEKSATDIKSSTLNARAKIEEALGRALEHDWKTALQLIKEAEIITPNEHLPEIKAADRMVWLCIQRTSIGPIIDDTEKAISEWDYYKAKTNLDNILLILKAARLPLDFGDYSLRVINITNSACSAADRWKNDVDKKLERTLSGTAVIKANVEEILQKQTERIMNANF